MSDTPTPSPKPLSKNARRVLGVLVEKAKTTPDNYPLSLAGIVSGSNQKSNRSPLTQLDDDDALLALDELRNAGAVREVQGSGRVTKYRHAAYEWFGVDAAGAAIMTELLLRGPQTAGELRSRASRMHPFDELSAVQSVLDTLIDKKLVESLTPPGRGQTFAHRLYPPEERQYLEAKLEKEAEAEARATVSASQTQRSSGADLSAVDRLIARLDSLNERIEELENRLEKLES
jgi:uncharacterized protein